MTGPPNRLVLELRTLVQAPPERVFDALTDPGRVARWWGPAGFTMPEIELDARPGGQYRFTMQPPEGAVFHLGGEFLAVEPPARLAYTFRYGEPDPDDRETVVTLTLAPRGKGTEVALTQGDFATEARLALHREGWSDSFDRLRTLIDAGG